MFLNQLILIISFEGFLLHLICICFLGGILCLIMLGRNRFFIRVASIRISSKFRYEGDRIFSLCVSLCILLPSREILAIIG